MKTILGLLVASVTIATAAVPADATKVGWNVYCDGTKMMRAYCQYESYGGGRWGLACDNFEQVGTCGGGNGCGTIQTCQ